MADMVKLFALSFTIDGDSIQLEQEFNCGEVHMIDMHICQLRLIAEKAGLLTGATTGGNSDGQ